MLFELGTSWSMGGGGDRRGGFETLTSWQIRKMRWRAFSNCTVSLCLKVLPETCRADRFSRVPCHTCSGQAVSAQPPEEGLGGVFTWGLQSGLTGWTAALRACQKTSATCVPVMAEQWTTPSS